MITSNIIRCLVDIDEKRQPFVVASAGESGGSVPMIWNGAGVEFQFALARHGTLITDISNLVSITLRVFASTRTGDPFLEQTVLLADLDQTVTAATWADGSKQHARFVCTALETALPATVAGTEYYLELSGYTADAPSDLDVFGWTQLYVVLRGNASTGPVQAGNLIPSGAEYDGSGEYALTVTADTYYRWTSGANDTSVVNGTETITTSNTNFISQGTTLTLHGTAGELVTAVLRPSPYLNADETAALVAALIGGLVSIKQGAQALSVGEEIVTVDISAHGLGATPTRIVPFLIKPAGGDKLGDVALIDGTATATSFQVELANPGPASGYSLGYMLF